MRVTFVFRTAEISHECLEGNEIIKLFANKFNLLHILQSIFKKKIVRKECG